MKAVILAAGVGNRLKVVTNTIPKPMIIINGKPLLEHNILMCKKAGVSKIFINLHHLPDKIISYFGDGSEFGVNIVYHLEKTLLGTAGSVNYFLDQMCNESFYVVYGDNYSNLDLTVLRKFHTKNNSDFTVVLYWKEDVSHSGVAELDSDNQIVRFIEKPKHYRGKSRWVNAGIYMINSNILRGKMFSQSDFSQNIIPALLEQQYHILGFKTDQQVYSIDTPELLEKVSSYYNN